MDSSRIYEKEKEGAYIQSFQGEEFIKGRNPTVTNLLNLPDVRDVSANAHVLKACLDRTFDLINPLSPDVAFLFPQKILENLYRFSDVFRGYRKATLGCNGLKNILWMTVY